ncbi:hypothetical protein Pmani_034703 [Petrolisthes manimaculis]|uniref:Fe2OG dioxygenase domain-containing protein n=1 Tax=Petrolisthes manimaculis TaxID=1843537 RepID=A0AAE1NNU1_9EUCA|nr:hypothetical protein Pmani_034703 [Petrolisthes manimaculis]
MFKAVVVVVVMLVSLKSVGVDAIDHTDNGERHEGEEGKEELSVKVVVGVEAGWRRGRVEEELLLATARRFHFSVQVDSEGEEGRCQVQQQQQQLVIYFPRGEGAIQGEGEAIAAALKDAGADILLPHHHDNQQQLPALVGWMKAVREAVKETRAISLTQLSQTLLGSQTLRHKHRAQLDTEGRVFHVLGQGTRIYSGTDESMREGSKDESKGNIKVEEEEDGTNNKKEGKDKGTEEDVKETPISREAGKEIILMRIDSGSYRVMVGDKQPLVLLVDRDSQRGRALLLAITDYLLLENEKEIKDKGDDRTADQKGRITLEEDTSKYIRRSMESDKENMLDKEQKKMVVVMGVFVKGPQPFLQEVLIALLQSGLDPHQTHFYIHNQVSEYDLLLREWMDLLREDRFTATQMEAVRSQAHVRNHLLSECERLECKWYVNFDTSAFINPGVLPRLLLHSRHPVITPAIRIQDGMESTFLRDLDPHTGLSASSWDHLLLLDGHLTTARVEWHASCVKKIYAVHRKVFGLLSLHYTHPASSSLTHLSSQELQDTSVLSDPSFTETDVDESFCQALRLSGVPMMVLMEPNLGGLVNTSGHTPTTPDLVSLASNPLIWRVKYLQPDWHQILRGELLRINRPCPEVYQFPTFTAQFCKDLLSLANERNQWSPALKKDMRKSETKVEEVPTVDQYLSDLNLEPLLTSLRSDVLQQLQLLAFPYSAPDNITMALVARFQAGEVAGLNQHHDASAISFLVTLADQSQYQGGELEFPRQKCRVRPGEGDVLVFPGRLTHPKTLHNVTQGILHHLIIHIDSLSLRHFH